MSRIRIVAGELGGRYLEAPGGRRTRPTREKVREAWFSALGPDLAGLRVVDLFAGSGALGLEALSRGAARVHFVEAHGPTVSVLADNVAALGVEDRAEVVRRDVEAFLDELAETAPPDEPAGAGEGGPGPFDLALADPPYGSGWPARLAARMREAPFAGLLCVEHEPGALDEAGAADRESVAWRRRYGDTELTFLRPAAPGEGREAPTDDTAEEGEAET